MNIPTSSSEAPDLISEAVEIITAIVETADKIQSTKTITGTSYDVLVRRSNAQVKAYLTTLLLMWEVNRNQFMLIVDKLHQRNVSVDILVEVGENISSLMK